MAVWWQQPTLRREDPAHGERPVTWLELVYDLIFVVVFAELATRFHGDVSQLGATRFILLTVPLWWVWMSVTLYDDRFATDDLSQRLITLAQMIVAAGLALTVAHATSEHRQGFAVAYIVARSLTIVLFWRAGQHNPEAKPFTSRLVLGSTLALVPWLLSLTVEPPVQFVLWGLGSVIDVLTPLVTRRTVSARPGLSPSHLPERFRLLVIIVIGEAVASALHGAATNEELPLLTGALGLSLAFMLAWTILDGALSGGGWPGWRSMALGYLLLPLVLSLLAFGAALHRIVAGAMEDVGVIELLLCLSVAATLITLSVMELAAGTAQRRIRLGAGAAMRLVAAAIILVIGFAATPVEPWQLLATLLVIVGGQTVVRLARSARPTRGVEPA